MLLDEQDRESSQQRSVEGCGRFRCGRLIDRQARCKMESASAPGLALHPNSASHKRDELSGNGQAQPGAAISSSRGIIRLSERLKDHCLFFLGDTDAGVSNGKVE